MALLKKIADAVEMMDHSLVREVKKESLLDWEKAYIKERVECYSTILLNYSFHTIKFIL